MFIKDDYIRNSLGAIRHCIALHGIDWFNAVNGRIFKQRSPVKGSETPEGAEEMVETSLLCLGMSVFRQSVENYEATKSN